MNDLQSAFSQLNLKINDKIIQKFTAFEQLLLDWNEKMNLTAITEPFEILTKHFLDSILPITVFDIPQNALMIDIGTGAGFPGIPIKLVRDDISLTLLDSLNKRINFLDEVVNQLGLNDISTIHGRAEDLGRNVGFREMFDVVTSRAVAELAMLAELCLPFVKVGGVLIALKSTDSNEEISNAKSIISELGSEIENEFTAAIPFTEISRKIVIIRKVAPTSEKFPRSIKKIKKSLQG